MAVQAHLDVYAFAGKEIKMKYAYINKNKIVSQFIHDEDPMFPGVPLEQRYSSEFIRQLVPCNDESVKLNWKYEEGEFHEPEPEPSDEISDSEALAIIMGEDVTE